MRRAEAEARIGASHSPTGESAPRAPLADRGLKTKGLLAGFSMAGKQTSGAMRCSDTARAFMKIAGTRSEKDSNSGN
jgi:hypothetical protein